MSNTSKTVAVLFASFFIILLSNSTIAAEEPIYLFGGYTTTGIWGNECLSLQGTSLWIAEWSDRHSEDHLFLEIAPSGQIIGLSGFQGLSCCGRDWHISGTISIPDGPANFSITSSMGASCQESWSFTGTVSDNVVTGTVTCRFDDYHIFEPECPICHDYCSLSGTWEFDILAGYTIIATSDGGGTITPSGTVHLQRGSCLTFDIIPDEGNEVADVLVDGVSIGAVTTYTFMDIQADHTIYASFAQANQPPIALFDVPPEDLFVREEIAFDASSSYDPEGIIVAYKWDFGDGSIAEGVSTIHIYDEAGKYDVILTVYDDAGLSDSYRRTITVLPARPTVEILAARMISPNELGVAIEVWFPETPADGSRFIRFTAVINGRSVQEEIDITAYTEPGQKIQVGLAGFSDHNTPDYRTPLRISFQRAGVPRFTDNEVFDLTAIAYLKDGTESAPDTEEIEIVLPVIFVHGYVGPDLIADILGNFVIFEQKKSLFDHLYKAYSEAEFVTGYRQNKYWYNEGKNGKCYKTLWYERYGSRKWNASKTCKWLDKLIRKTRKFTWANKVDIIAHSLGGLVSRHYVTKCGGASKVRKVIMIGTPNNGSSMFYKATDGWDYFRVKKELRIQSQESNSQDGSLAQWLIPKYQALYNAKGTPLVSSIRNNFPPCKEPPVGVKYYNIYNKQIPTPLKLTVKKIFPHRYNIYNKPIPPPLKLTIEKILPLFPHGKHSGDQYWFKLSRKRPYRQMEGGDGTVSETGARLNLGRTKNIPLRIKTSHIWLPESDEIQAEVLKALKE